MPDNDTIIQNKESLAQKASLLNIASQTIAKCLYVGNFKSMYQGRGIDFAGVREYLPGDDVRSLDWNVTARMGKPFVKLFEEDKQIIIFLIVDRSESMESGTGTSTRLETATQTAALMLFAGFKNSSPVGGILFDAQTEFSAVPKSGKNNIMLFFKKLDTKPVRKKKGTALAQSLRVASKLLKNRCLVMVLSDFRCADYETELGLLATKHDVIAVRITDPSDEALPSVGNLNFCDPETDCHITLNTASETFRQDWKNYNERHVKRWQSACAKRGVSTLTVSTEQDPAQELTAFFLSRRNG